MYDELIKWLREFQAITEHCDEQQSCFECENRELCDKHDNKTSSGNYKEAADAIEKLSKRPEIPTTGIGDLSDGYHTFNGLYYQRMVLFAALVKAYKDKAWKSWEHEDGELCFGGGWFIVGIDTPQGSYTYHYEGKDWNRFDCVELPVAKHWDGHTEEDVTRLLSLDVQPVKHGRWIIDNPQYLLSHCSKCQCFNSIGYKWKYCPNCGATMDGETDG